MSDYVDPYWTEVVADDSPLERAREDADLREWEEEQRRDLQISLEVPHVIPDPTKVLRRRPGIVRKAA